jgi:hypothetical protein
MSRSERKFEQSTSALARPTAKLSDSLSRRLNAYALTATAAGVAGLAFAPSAEAAPICKTLSIEIPSTNTYPMYLGDQEAAPFDIAQTTLRSTTSSQGFFWWNRGFFIANSGQAQVLLASNQFAANLESGANIGPGGDFGKGNSYGLMFTYGPGFAGDPQGHGTLAKHIGNFNLQQTNYIGFHFSKSGAAHYGWVRLSVSFQPMNRAKVSTIHILGYGYESTPNTAISAGSCAGDQAKAGAPDTSSASADASLGMLALGSVGVTNWKKPAF